MVVTGNLTRGISPARRVAFATLEAVAAGAYASDELRERSVGLTSRDAGLAAQIVFGCLRFQNQLDYLIRRYSGRTAERMDLAVQIGLRAGIFQVRYLERVPAHAAVHESVEWVKRRKRSAAGLVNAVLRKVKNEPVEWPDEATELACPEWLLKRWTEHFGHREAQAIARAALREPEAYIRLGPGSEAPEALQLEATEIAGGWKVISGEIKGLRLHDISSQAIVPLLDLKAGQTFLDLCAAPGNKTLQALEEKPALAVACDVSPGRLEGIPAILPRVVLDATQRLPFRRPFDRVFIDAPCSGTGTIGRNPEIKWRLVQNELPRFAERQRKILDRGLSALAPGGKLVYATCSLDREENEDVIKSTLERQSGVALMSETWRLPGRDPGDGFYAAVLTKEAPAR